ncbi:MAG: hypothetical protein ACN4GR_12575 [Arenicellales bacterium]
MANPSLINDGTRFFPNILKDLNFQKKGVLALTEGTVSWAVVDPRRHKMTIWEKDQDEFPAAAKSQTNASVITNGPFLLYSGGNKWQAVFKYHVHNLWKGSILGGGIKGSVSETLDHQHKIEKQLKKKYYSSHAVEGYIFGDSEHIVEDTNSRPGTAYFGRKVGRLFTDYVITRGDPPHHPEVIGGLFTSVENYQPVDNGTATQVGTWGLAPIATATDQQKIELQDAGLVEALEQYEESIRQENEEIIPFGEGVAADSICDGLLLAAFGPGAPNYYANLNAGVLVKSAVRVDGNSSILLGHYGTLLQGEHMIDAKVYYNKYGYRFKPG